MTYNWQLPDWPHFRYDLVAIQDVLYQIAEKMGHVSGLMKGLPEAMRTETILDLMVSEAVKTSEIEGEMLSRADVMSSIRNKLALNIPPEAVRDPRAAGMADLIMDVRRTFAEPLTRETLFDWHRMLFQARARNMQVGQWRDHPEPMQIISGAIGKIKVHFEAPPSDRVAKEMAAFIDWFNASAPGEAQAIKPVAVRSAIAHLYFESIHPFEDGNGRIGRAISEKALSQGVGYPIFLSLSKTIEGTKKQYYAALKLAQRSNEITAWIHYFAQTIRDAQIDAEQQIEFVLKKAKFFDRYADHLDERHLKVLRRMLDEGPAGFEGGINAQKFMRLTSVSKATATRELQHLHTIGVLRRVGAGRNTRYEVAL